MDDFSQRDGSSLDAVRAALQERLRAAQASSTLQAPSARAATSSPNHAGRPRTSPGRSDTSPARSYDGSSVPVPSSQFAVTLPVPEEGRHVPGLRQRSPRSSSPPPEKLQWTQWTRPETRSPSPPGKLLSLKESLPHSKWLEGGTIVGPDGQPLDYSTFLQEAMLLANEAQKRKELEEAARHVYRHWHRHVCRQ